MLEVLLDAYVLAVPEIPEHIDRYIRLLTDLQQMVDQEGIRIASTADALVVLSERYPSWNNIPRSHEISLQDVNRVVSRLLASPVEDRVGVIMLEIRDPQCSPDAHLSGRAPSFILHHHQLLFLATLLKERSVAEPTVLTDTELLSGVEPCIQVNGAGIVLLGLDGDDDLIERPYTSTVTVVGSLNDLVRCADPVSLWQIKGSENLAFEIYLAQRQGVRAFPTGLTWRFGREFLTGVARHGFNHEPSKIRRLLEACGDVVLDILRGELHPIRTGKGGNDPPLVRMKDSAAAMRRDIDDEFHLHWWRTSTGPEFAWMGVHWDLHIPE